MSDQVTQQVMVEFLGSVSATMEKAFKEVIGSLHALTSQQKSTNEALNQGSKTMNAQAAAAGKFATETDKITESKKKFKSVLKSLALDYKANEAGLTSVASAFGYYSKGVTQGNNSIDIAKKRTTDYMAALMGTNSVLMSSDKTWESWAKNVKFSTINQAVAREEILLTKNGIALLTSEAGKHIGLSKEQVKVLQQSTLAQDVYSKKLREAQLIGGDYLKSFVKLSGSIGSSDKNFATWGNALDKAHLGLNNLRTTAAASTNDVGKLALGVGRSSIALQIMEKNLKVSGGSFKIYNEQGLKALGMTEEQASKLGMLARSYGAYGTTLQKMSQNQDSNLKSFKELTATYGTSNSVVGRINKALAETDKIMGTKLVATQTRLNAEVAAGTMTQTQADRALRNYKNSLDVTGTAAAIFDKTQKDLVYGTRQYTSEMARATSFGQKYQDAFAAGISKYGAGSTAFKDYSLALNTVEKSINATGKAMNAAGKNGDAFMASANRTTMATNLMDNKLNIFNGTLGNSSLILKPLQKELNSFGTILDKLGTSMMNVARYSVGAFAFYGAVSAITGIMNQVMQYDQSLKDLQAITSATDYQTELFGETIKEVAGKTKFSAQEVAEGMKNLGQAGFSAAETIEVIGEAATLATGTLSNFETVTDLLTTTIRAYHLEASEAGRLTDLFANAINRSKLDVDKLRVAFNYLASVADKANISVDDSVTLMGMLANAGVRASTIGTSLRQVLEGLVSPNKELKEAIARAGYTVDQFVVTAANPLEDVIRRLQQVVPDAAAAFDLFGIRGAPAISAITEHGVQGFMEMKNSMQEAGSAAKMAEIQMEGLANKAKNMKDKFELVAIALGEAGLKSALEVVIDLGRGFADMLAGVLNSSVGKIIVGLTALAAAVALVNTTVKLFMAMSWVQSLGVAGAAAIGLAGEVNILTAAVGALRAMSLSLFTTPLGWIALAASVAVAAVAFVRLKKAHEDYGKTAEKNKALMDAEIKLSEKKKTTAQSLLAIAKDSTRTDAERTVAIQRLETLGVEVNGVLRDQRGIVINLDEAVKNATPNVGKFADEMDRLSESKRAQKMLEDVDALIKISKEYEDAVIRVASIEKTNKKVGTEFGADLDDPNMVKASTVDKDIEKVLAESQGALDTANQKVQEIIGSWMALDKESYAAMLKKAGMAKADADQAAKNFDAMDESYLEFWLNQTEYVKKHTAESEAAILKLITLLKTEVSAIQNTPEAMYKKVQQQMQTSVNKVYDSMPDLDDPKRDKSLGGTLATLDKLKGKVEEVQAIGAKGLWEMDKIPNLPTERITEGFDAVAKANEHASKSVAEDTKKLVDEAGASYDLLAETRKIGIDNQINALEIASAKEIGIEQDTANAIIRLKRGQIDAEISAKSSYLALLKASSPNEVQEIMQLENNISALKVQRAGLTAQEVANVESKKRDERERAESTRAYNHSMNLLEIDKTYWEDKNQQEYFAREETISFLDKEIEIQKKYIAERKAQGQRTFDEEQELRDLELERVQELYDKEIQAKINQKELERQLTDAKITNLEYRADNYDDPEAELEAMRMRQAVERKEWQDHYANLAQDKTLYNAIMRELAIKHQNEQDAIERKRRSLEYQKNAEFFGELSGLMGEFYQISNQKAIAFFYAQKALAVAEIIMNAHAGSAAALGAGPFGIPMSAVILAMGYAKAGIVAGLTVAQGTKGFADGGEITGYSPHSRADNIPINATAGEFMQPVPTVQYYGKGAMEALRTRSIPREVLSQWSKPSSKAGGRRFAEGGEITRDTPETSGKQQESVQIVNILDPAMFDQYLASHAGQKALMNVISRNPAIIKSAGRS